jgi:hypothetical protein
MAKSRYRRVSRNSEQLWWKKQHKDDSWKLRDRRPKAMEKCGKANRKVTSHREDKMGGYLSPSVCGGQVRAQPCLENCKLSPCPFSPCQAETTPHSHTHPICIIWGSHSTWGRPCREPGSTQPARLAQPCSGSWPEETKTLALKGSSLQNSCKQPNTCAEGKGWINMGTTGGTREEWGGSPASLERFPGESTFRGNLSTKEHFERVIPHGG